MQSFCVPQDSDTLFFGPKKHIQDLWALVDAQKKHILDLERQLCSLGARPKHSQQQQLKSQHHHDQRPAGDQCHAKLNLPTPGSKSMYAAWSPVPEGVLAPSQVYALQ
jgi:hypothetical protein